QSVLGAALAVAACVEPQLVPCGDRSCPRGTTCVLGDTSAAAICATGDQLAACAGEPDGDTCTSAGGVGRCTRGVCVAVGCGNGVVDLGELCDDGNQTSGDGCRADCGKLERCGDGVVDQGEACDDGNANPSDGCDACAVTTWTASAVIGGSVTATAIGMTPSA